MFKAEWEQTITENIQLTFSRSAGPGGQNVNKVNTKVTARLSLSCLVFFTEVQIAGIKTALKNRITNQDEIVIQVQDMRNQVQNRITAVQRMVMLIRNALKVNKKRIGTKPSRAIAEKRLKLKKEAAQKKRSRRLL